MNARNSLGLVLYGVILAALLSPAASAQAADLRFAGVLPGGLAVIKDLVSMREARYAHLIEQQTDFSCGAAALATILKYAYGRNVDEPEVIGGMLKVSDPKIVAEKGFSLLDMKRYVETIGMRGRGYEVTAETLERIKVPVIVLLDLKGYKHFVVLKSTTREAVYLGDPALGNRIMNKEDFVRSWNGIVFAVIGSGFIRNTVLINPPPPLTAKRLRDVQATSLTNAQLLEFGFGRADLF